MNPTKFAALFLAFSSLAYAGKAKTKAAPHTSLFAKAKDGSQGWTEAYARHARGKWMNSTLIIVTPAKKGKTFHGSRGFIQEWSFTDDDKNVVICSRGAHGPSWIQKFEIASGELVAECSGSDFLAETPAWAHPWCDETRIERDEKEAQEKQKRR